MSEDPLFDEIAALDGKVAERRRQLAARDAAAAAAGALSATPAQPDAEVAAAVAGLLGIRVVSEAEMARLDAEREKADRERRAEMSEGWKLAAWHAVCPPEFCKPWEWGKAKGDPAALRRVLEWNGEGCGLFILGDTGHAKTRAVFAMLRRLVIERGMKPVVMSGVEFANAAASNWSDPSRGDAWLAGLVRAPLVFIDDLGKRWNPSAAEAGFELINQRTAWHRPTILTSNYDEPEFATFCASRGDAAAAQDLTTPMFRRIRDYLTPVVV